jgi:hypothetical protein
LTSFSVTVGSRFDVDQCAERARIVGILSHASVVEEGFSSNLGHPIFFGPLAALVA